jgi:hypothetical protein
MKRLRGFAILLVGIPFYIYTEHITKEARKSLMASEFGSVTSNHPFRFNLAHLVGCLCF